MEAQLVLVDSLTLQPVLELPLQVVQYHFLLGLDRHHLVETLSFNQPAEGHQGRQAPSPSRREKLHKEPLEQFLFTVVAQLLERAEM
jgi:hypothetical protein